MKKLLFILLSGLLFSCEDCKDSSFKIEVTYINGEKDTFFIDKTTCEDNNLYLNNSCIYEKYESTNFDANFRDCLVCGVRSYKRLNQK
jgi:hypothetical protein